MLFFFPSATDPERAELLACRRAVELAQEMGISKLALELDNVGAVAKLTGECRDHSIHGPLVEDIKTLLQSFTEHSVRHVRRSCNQAAHRLAKEGCDYHLCNTWVDEPPGYIVNLLALDCVGS